MGRFDEFDKVYKECSKCNGTGEIRTVIACPNCNGAGCDDCNWKGEAIGWDTCPNCNGTGYVRR